MKIYLLKKNSCKLMKSVAYKLLVFLYDIYSILLSLLFFYLNVEINKLFLYIPHRHNKKFNL